MAENGPLLSYESPPISDIKAESLYSQWSTFKKVRVILLVGIFVFATAAIGLYYINFS